MTYFIDFWLSEEDYQRGERAICTLPVGTDARECEETVEELRRDSGCYVRAREEAE